MNLGSKNMDGLIIKKKWLDLIMSGKKTLEIRGCDTHKLNEPIYLLESGTHLVRGICIIVSSHLMTYQNWEKFKNLHCVNLSFLELNKHYHTAYGWELKDVKPVKETLYYKHPKGAVIWVKDVKFTETKNEKADMT